MCVINLANKKHIFTRDLNVMQQYNYSYSVPYCHGCEKTNKRLKMASLEDAIKYGLAKLGYKETRGPQRQVVDAYALGKDVFLSAPTGSGKSLCFEIVPYVLDCMKRGLHQVDEESTKTVCVVVAPLVFLMKDQVAAQAGSDMCRSRMQF